MGLLQTRHLYMNNKDQNFKTQLNDNGDMNFTVSLNSNPKVVSAQLTKTNQSLDTKPNLSNDSIEISGQINNTVEDSFYDEIIFYDGGGVEGYGY